MPTRDIHMNQVGLEPQWIKLLQDYVHPVQLKVFQGYHSTVCIVILDIEVEISMSMIVLLIHCIAW